MHAKYKVSISYGSEVKANVKVDNSRQTNRQTDRTKTIYPDHSIWGYKNKHSFQYSEARLWNGLPANGKNATSLYAVKNSMVKHIVTFQCQASIYTLPLCRGHSWRVRLAKQETLTPPGHLVLPLVCRGPWMSTLVLYCWYHSDSALVLLYFI